MSFVNPVKLNVWNASTFRSGPKPVYQSIDLRGFSWLYQIGIESSVGPLSPFFGPSETSQRDDLDLR